MATLQAGIGDMITKVSDLGKQLSPITGAAGFIAGVDAKWQSQNAGTTYPFSTQGLADAIAGIAGNSTAKMIFPTYSGAANRVFNPIAILNTGTYAAVALSLLKHLFPNKYTRLAYNLGFPPALGYGIGRIFDDPPSQPTSSGYNTSPGNNLSRAASSLTNTVQPWTNA